MLYRQSLIFAYRKDEWLGIDDVGRPLCGKGASDFDGGANGIDGRDVKPSAIRYRASRWSACSGSLPEHGSLGVWFGASTPWQAAPWIDP